MTQNAKTAKNTEKKKKEREEEEEMEMQAAQDQAARSRLPRDDPGHA